MLYKVEIEDRQTNNVVVGLVFFFFFPAYISSPSHLLCYFNFETTFELVPVLNYVSSCLISNYLNSETEQCCCQPYEELEQAIYVLNQSDGISSMCPLLF